MPSVLRRLTIKIRLERKFAELISDRSLPTMRLIATDSSVWRRSVDVIDYEHIHGTAHRRELETELVLHGINSGAIDILIRWWSSTFNRRCHNLLHLQLDFEGACQARSVDHRLV